MRKTNRILSLVLAIAMVVGLIPAMTISSSAAYSNKLKFDENGKFTVVQITDIQDDKEVHEDTLALITKAMNRYSPDLVVMTGDNIAGSMSNSDFQSSVNQFMAPIINAGVPYAITFGNHDDEDGTLVNTPSRDEQYNYYVGMSDLAVDFDVDALSGTGSGSIPIYSNDGSAVKFAIFPMDSGSYDENGDYDHVKADQNAWYESEVAALGNVPHLVFQHIIVPEVYTTLLKEVTSSTAGAIRGTGQWGNYYYILDPNNSTITGEMNEGPCPSAINGGQYQSWLKTGKMVGCFVGHDHTNSFVGTDSNGILIGYTQAGTMHSYGTHDPACRVFTIDENGTYTTEHITLSGMDMESAGDYEHETVAGTPTVPSRLIVGAAGNGLAQQKLGNVIQAYSVNHKTQALYPNDMEITIDLDSSVQSVTLTPPTGVTVGNYSVTPADKDGALNTHRWYITGGTATAGSAAEYKFEYVTADGATLTQYAYSYVDNISTPAGYYVFSRNYRGGNNKDNWNSQEYVMTVLGETVYGDARYQTDNPAYGYEGKEIGSWTNATAGYYNYTQEEDAGFVGMGDPEYGMIYTSPARANCRTVYHFTRFTDAGKSPVATAYVDTNEITSISDLGISVNYWRHSATDHGLTTAFDLSFKIGDSGYTTSNLQENTAGTTSIDSNISSVTLAAARGSNTSFAITGTLPADGDKYTVISHGYSYWDGGYSTEHHTYMPVLLKFVTYNKAELKELVNAERAAMRQTNDIVYRAAFMEAYKQMMKINTTQGEIDSAVSMLKNAADSLVFDGEDLTGSSQNAGKANIPPVIYIGGEGYGLSQQPTGNKILKGIVDYASNTMNYEYSKFYFTVPENASKASVVVTESNGNTVESNYEKDTGVGQITGGTSSKGAYLIYTFTYTIGGDEYTQVEASAVLEVPQAAGWTSMVKGSTTMNAGVYRTVFETAVMFGHGGTLPAGAYYTASDVYSGANYGINLDASSNNNFVGYGYQKVAGVGMNWWEVTRARQSEDVDWLNGYDGEDGKKDFWSNPGEDQGYRARFDITIDSSVIPNLGSIGTGFKYLSLQNQNRSSNGTSNNANPTVLEISNTGFFSGFVPFSSVVNNVNKTTAVRLGTSYNAEGVAGDTTYGVKAGDTLSIIYGLEADGLPAAGEYTYWTELKNKGNYTTYAHYLWNFTINYVDKSALRNLVAKENEMNRQLIDGYDNSDGSFTAYRAALAESKAMISNVLKDSTETTASYNKLVAAIQALKYKSADYTALNAKIAEVRKLENGVFYYRPHINNDPTYYATGEFYAWDCYSSTNEIDIPIDNIDWGLDIRQQKKVDQMVSAIDVGWINVRLIGADYTNVDYYLSQKVGTGENGAAGGASINTPPKYEYLYLTNTLLPASYYTTASYNKWTDACAAGQSNRSLKKPDQPIVDGYAADLQTAYEALELLPADFTELDNIEEVIAETASLTVEVIDPSNSANNYDIPYYNPEIIAQIEAKKAERDNSLLIVQQDNITLLVNELDALYNELTQSLNKVDMTFANEQKARVATYESDPETYYTPESWNRLVAARAAVTDKLASKEVDSQVTVNAAAQEIYDAYEALEYNEADYTKVNKYLGLIAELEPNKEWYSNWSVVEAAVAKVVTGLDATQQAAVNTMGDDLETAYNGLVMLNASYADLYADIQDAQTKMAEKDNYTEDTYNDFLTAYNEAQTLYTDGQTNPLKINQQSVIDTAEDKLEQAIIGLKYKDANIQPIVDAMNKYGETVYDGMYNGEYPDADEDGDEDILDNVKAAYAVAESWMERYNNGELTIKNDAEIKLAADTLEALRAALPAAYSMVYDVLYDPYTGDALYDVTTDGKLSAYITTLEANLLVKYTDDSVAEVITALRNLSYSLRIDDQAVVEEASYTIGDAVNALEYREADLTELKKAKAEGEAKVALADDTTWFTADSWEEYEAAYNAAIDIIDADPAYMYSEQDIVNEAAADLALAVENLEYVDADYDALNTAITTATNLNRTDWLQDENWDAMTVALVNAKAVQPGLKIDSQKDIDTITETLVDAINALVPAGLELVGIGDTIIDNERGFIYGLYDVDTNGEITDLISDGLAMVKGNGYIKQTAVGEYTNLGTGAKVELIKGEDDGDDTNNEVVATYYIVIFGDNNGDGYILADDTVDIIKSYAYDDSNYDYEDLSDAAEFAMDLNADGLAEPAETFYIIEYAAWGDYDYINQNYTPME